MVPPGHLALISPFGSSSPAPVVGPQLPTEENPRCRSLGPFSYQTVRPGHRSRNGAGRAHFPGAKFIKISLDRSGPERMIGDRHIHRFIGIC